MELIDLRNQGDQDWHEVGASSPDATFLVTASQAARASRLSVPGGHLENRIIAVLPDFLTYSRLLGSGQFRTFLGQAPSTQALIAALIRAGLTGIRHPLRLLRQDFWLIARALIGFDEALLPPGFVSRLGGKTVLHPFLSDLAFSLGQREFVEKWQGSGIWTQQTALGLSLLAQWNLPPSVFLHPEPGQNLDTRTALDLAIRSEIYRKTTFLGL